VLVEGENPQLKLVDKVIISGLETLNDNKKFFRNDGVGLPPRSSPSRGTNKNAPVIWGFFI
jgi:hypothetical protein